MASTETKGAKLAKNAGKPEKRKKQRPGRPLASESSGIDRRTILAEALELSKNIPLQDLSVVVVARSMNIAPSLVHYYIGGRDWLTSGIMNLFYKDIVLKWPTPSGDWKKDIAAACRTLFAHLSEYPGIVAYLVSNARHRTFQLVAPGEKDYGVETLERLAGLVSAPGLPPERVGIYTHILTDMTYSIAHSSSFHLFPKDHRDFLQERVAGLDPQQFKTILTAGLAPFNLDGETVFAETVDLVLLGLDRERAAQGRTTERP